MTEPTFGVTGPGDPVGRIANNLAAMAEDLARGAQISRFDLCVALANTIGFILADAAKPKLGGKALPRSQALERMDALRKVMEGAYDLRDIEGGDMP